MVRKIISIFFFAIISNTLWLIEIFYHGWEGKIWIKYHHISFYFIAILFTIWIIYIDGIKNRKKIFIDIIIYNITYFILLLIFSIVFIIIFDKWLIFAVTLKLNISPLNTIVLLLIFQIGIILLINLIFAKYEKVKINRRLFCIIIGSIPSIILFTIIISYFIIKLQLPFDGIIWFLDPIHWLKMGSIIFGFIIYECTYIVYLKNQNGA